MLIRKNQAGSSAHANLSPAEYPGGPRVNHGSTEYEWPSDGAVVEVAAEHARELLAIPDGGFSEVLDESEPAKTSPAARPAGRRAIRE